MKRLVIIILFLPFFTFAQTTLWTEDFSTSSNYSVTLGGEGNDGTSDYFQRTDGSNIGISYSGNNGYFFAAQDIDDGGWSGSASPSQLTWTGINIDGYTNLTFTGLFASAATSKIDETDYIIVEVNIDGGGWTKILEFENDGSTYNTYFMEDTDFDGTGDGTQLTSTFQSFTKSISGTGSSMDIRITVAVNAGGEDCAFDEFKIEGDAISCSAPTTQASSITFSGVTESSFVVGWTNGNGSNRIVKINTTNSFTDPVDGTEYTGNSTYSGSGEQVVYAGNGNSVTVDGLSPGTTYWIRVYEYNCTGSNTVYNTSTASDNPNSQTTLTCNTPTSASTDITFSSVTSSSITVSWTAGDGAYHLVVARQGTAVTSTPSDGTTYNASSVFGSGDDIGSGEYVVYSGDQNSVTVSGLQDSTRYYFRIFEYNCSGGNEVYLTSQSLEGDTMTEDIPDPAVLERGDLAVLGVCSNISSCISGSGSGDDEISFVCFKDITPGTEIDLTDNGWQRVNADEWGNTEGYYRIKRTGSTINAGTVITIRLHNSTPHFEGVFPDNDWSLEITEGVLVLNSNGDQIFFMQNGTWDNGTSGDHDATYDGTILFGFNTNDEWLDFGASTQESGLPYQMECFSMIPRAASDFLKYTGPTSPASQMEWIGRINDGDNWTSYANCAEYYAASPDYTNGDTIEITTTYIDDEFKWFGRRDSSWFNCGNWSTLRVPDATNDVEIPNSTQVENNIYLDNGDTAKCKNLTLNHPDYKIIGEGNSSKVLEIGGNLTINAGTIDFDDEDNSTNDGEIYLTGDWINNSTADAFVPGNSVIHFNGSGTQNITTSGKKDIFGTVIINSGVTLNSNGDTIIIYGNWNNSGTFDEDTSTVVFADSSAQTIASSATETFYKLKINNPVSVTMNNNVTVNDTLFLYGGQIVINGHTLTINKQLIRDTGTFTGSSASNLIINIPGSLYDSLYFTQGGQLLNNLSISANGDVNLGTDLTIGGTMTVNSGAVFVLNSNNITLNGTVSGTGLIRGDANAGIYIGGNGNLGTLYFEAANNLLDTLSLNRTSGEITLGSDLSVTQYLNLTNGIISTGTNTLTVTNDAPASVANYNTNSYIDGNLRRYVQTTGEYGLPVGDGMYEEAILRLNSSSGISYFDAKFTHPASFTTDISSLGLSLNGTPVTTLLDYGYWTIAPDNYTTVNYDITLTSRGHTNGGSDPAQHTIVKRHDSSSDWEVFPANHDNSTQSGTGTNPITAKLSALTDFSDFAIARSDDLPLPVELLYFKGHSAGSAIVLEWETATEINNNFFTIEHSTDGKNFSILGKIPGGNYSLSPKHYTFTDYSPSPGTNYYKLLQTDYDGLTKEKGITAVNIKDDTGFRYSYSNRKLQIFSNGNNDINIEIFDLTGRNIFKTQTGNLRYKVIDLTGLNTGIYLVRFKVGDKIYPQKIIVK